ncbi:MAG: hypothetical protein KKC30_11475 [Proteobacteria bacterium]|nr:hypothetical protein [Pseudomonadota bacterium]MBU4382436.1 hypothetical protein [Pseudomonadota bacterium]MBU4604507.1 hypothetical protein [Pseudomonadota bacterium]MCG2764005.1 hypothetical protein [Desulfarculaceae bacterium]
MDDLRPTIKSLERQVEQAAQLLSEQGMLPAGQVLGLLRGVVNALGRVAEACPRLQGE